MVKMPKKSMKTEMAQDGDVKSKKSEKKVSKKFAKLALDLSDEDMDSPNGDAVLEASKSGKIPVSSIFSSITIAWFYIDHNIYGWVNLR